MAGETRLAKELNKLIVMPYFWQRFISLSLLIFGDEFARIFVKSNGFIPFLAVTAVSLICFIVFETLALKKLKIKPSSCVFSKQIMVLWISFALICLISELIHGIPLNSLILLFFLPVFVLMGQEENFFNFFLFSCGFTVLALIVTGFVFYPLTDNNFSLSTATFIPIILCALAWVLLNQKKFYTSMFVFFTLLAAGLLFLSGVSGGRTGFLTIISTVFLFIIAVLIKFISAKKNIFYKNRTINFAIILCVIILISLTVSGAIVIDSLYEVPKDIESIENKTILDKFYTSLNNGNPLSNRGMIWKYTFDNIKLFGNGPNFYTSAEILTPDQNSAHNAYLAVLGHFGIIAFALFTVFCVIMLILSVRYGLSARRLYIFPFTVFTAFFVGGITEDLLIAYSPRAFALLFYAACAYLIIIEGQRENRTSVTRAEL